VSAPAPDLGEAPPPLEATDSFATAARAAMWPQVKRMLELEPALRQADAGDNLKRYRVATRRLRAALRVFEDALPKRAVRDIAPELAGLARAVGSLRDLDVRIGSLPVDDDVQPLRDAWGAERADAARDVEERLDAKRHGRLLADLVSIVHAGDGSAARERRGRRTVRDRAGSAIWASFERLRSAATTADAADLVALHDIRIRAKRLRYTLEFLAPVLGSERDWLIARLVALQDHLGAMHDADLAAAAARAFLEASGDGVTEDERAAIAAYAADRSATVERHGRGLSKALAPIAASGFARRLALAILGPEEAGRPAS
jgi:CHAD domain-containing protein